MMTLFDDDQILKAYTKDIEDNTSCSLLSRYSFNTFLSLQIRIVSSTACLIFPYFFLCSVYTREKIIYCPG